MIESPRWLIAHGRIDDARQILAHLTSKTAKPTDAVVVEQSREIEDAIALEQSISGDFSYKELFQNGELQNFRRICLCFGIQLMQQVNNYVLSISPKIELILRYMLSDGWYK